MLQGVTLGIPVQCISVVGYLMIANVTAIKSEIFRTGLMLAFPVISLIAELILGRAKLSSLGVHDLVGFAVLVAGYVVTVSKPLLE
jgi:hypothetical protein